MPHGEILRQLVTELERVGVDPDQMVAGLTSRAEEALRALRSLPDGAGPTAFLARLRNESSVVTADRGHAGANGAAAQTNGTAG